MTIQEAEIGYIRAYSEWQNEEWREGQKSLKHRLFGLERLEQAAQHLEQSRREGAGMEPVFEVGERVIFCTHFADLDGLRGVIETAYPGGYYDVRFDDDSQRERVWESKLLSEAEYPDYPLPDTGDV